MLFYMQGNDENESQDVAHEFNLVLMDDPWFQLASDHTQDVLSTLDDFRHQVNVVFRMVATTMSQ